MRADRLQSPPQATTIGLGTMILAAIGCFSVGFGALMIVPRIWPQYTQTPIVADAQPAKPREASAVLVPLPPAVSAAQPGVISEIKPTSAPTPVRISAYGTLAELAECKAAMRTGGTYAKISPEQMAAMLGTRGRPLTAAQIDAGCRKLTE